METITLSHLNSAFRLEGSATRRSLEIRTAQVIQPPPPDHSVRLKLLVLDEKDIPIYSQALVPTGPQANTRVYINKTFVFYDHLTVKLEAEPPASAFEAEVEFI